MSGCIAKCLLPLAILGSLLAMSQTHTPIPELGTEYWCSWYDAYLNGNGTIAFVLPQTSLGQVVYYLYNMHGILTVPASLVTVSYQHMCS